MTRTELFLQTLVSIFSLGMVKSYFCFSFIRFPQWAELWTKQYTLKQCLNTKSDYTVT